MDATPKKKEFFGGENVFVLDRNPIWVTPMHPCINLLMSTNSRNGLGGVKCPIEPFPFDFVGTGCVGSRLFRGGATLTEDGREYVVSGTALTGTGRASVVLYWTCGWAVFIGSSILLAWIASRFGYYSTPPTLENLSKNPGKMIPDLVAACSCIAGGFLVSVLLCRFVFRTRATARLSPAEVSAIIKGGAFTEPQGENKPPIQKRYVTIKMKNSECGIRIVCRQEHVDALSAVLGVPLEEYDSQQAHGGRGGTRLARARPRASRLPSGEGKECAINEMTSGRKAVKRLKVATIMALFAVGVVLRDIGVWAVALVQAGVTLGVYIGPLMKAADRLMADLGMMPVRLILALLLLLGVGIGWVEKVFPEVVEFVRNDLPLLK